MKFYDLKQTQFHLSTLKRIVAAVAVIVTTATTIAMTTTMTTTRIMGTTTKKATILKILRAANPANLEAPQDQVAALEAWDYLAEQVLVAWVELVELAGE